jgi:hypothetical protein
VIWKGHDEKGVSCQETQHLTGLGLQWNKQTVGTQVDLRSVLFFILLPLWHTEVDLHIQFTYISTMLFCRVVSRALIVGSW